MKKFVIAWCIVVAFAILMGIVACAETYPQTFVIESINLEQDCIILMDFNGNEWIWSDVEDYEKGDIIAAIMEDNGTEIIYDDIIINIRYSGYIEGWE